MKTVKMRKIEQEKGQDIEIILSDLFTKHRNQADIAAELGISQSTLVYWLLKLGLEQRSVLVEKDAS